MCTPKATSSATMDTNERDTETAPLLHKISDDDLESLGGRPLGLVFRSSKSFITFVVCVAVFTDTFLYTMIIPILPDTLTRRAGVVYKDVQSWISILLGVYGVANLITSPIAGYVIDKLPNRKLPLLFSLYALGLSTGLYCFATTPTTLVIARALQGSSSTVLWVAGMALLSDTMGASAAGSAMGWQAVGRFIGLILGPSLSGVVFEVYGHFAVFAMALAVLLFDVILRFIMIERKVAEKWVKTPKTSYSTVVGVSTPTPTTAKGNKVDIDVAQGCDGCPASDTQSKIAVSVVPGTMDLLRNPRILMALWAQFTCAVVLTALESVLPLYTMGLFNWTPAESGLLFILLAFSIILDPYIGKTTDIKGPRIMSVVGFSSSAALWVAFCAVTNSTLIDKFILCGVIFALGFSIGLISTPNTVEISLSVDDMNLNTLGGFDTSKVMGLAYSFMNMSYGMGSIFGPFLGGILIQISGWRVLCINFAVLNGLSACLAFLFSGTPGSQRRREPVE